MERYAGTVRYLVEDPDIRWDSWDAVVALGEPDVNSEHLRILQIGGDPAGRRGPTGSYLDKALSLTVHVGDELEIPDDLPADLRELVKKELLPLVNPRVHRVRIAPWRLASGPGESDDYWPLLRDLDGYALAALYRPPRDLHECLYLPEHIFDIAPWLLYAFKRWAEELPEVFPSEPEWTSNPTWMTQSELSAVAEVADRKAVAERVMAEHQAAVAEAEAALVNLRDAVDGSDRLLLTGTGNPLVGIVQQTLEGFGFQVTNVDEQRQASGQDLREDLRVSERDWISLCEIKGYTTGGRPSDISKLNRFAALYVQENGQLPSAMWYVVNQFRNTDPTNRKLLLRNQDDDVDVFAGQGGLIIDTRDLFRLNKAVAAGSISPEAVRSMLTGSTGRFELPEDFGDA